MDRRHTQIHRARRTLLYPLFENPFFKLGFSDDNSLFGQIWQPDGGRTRLSDPNNRFLAHPYTIGRSAAVMIAYHLHDQNPLWMELAKSQIDRAAQLTVDKGEYAYYPSGHFAPYAKPDPQSPMPLAGEATGGRVGLGAAQLYRASGYEPALVLAKKLAHYTRRHSKNFDEEGRFLTEPHVVESGKVRGTKYGKEGEDLTYGGHYHNHTLMLLANLEYALAANDREEIEFVRKSYDWARNQGSNLIGFFPEYIVPDYPSCEICEVADMLAIAVKLSEAGIDRWEDAERWLRNQFSECQLRRPDWIYRMGEQMPAKPVAFNETADRMPERNVGCFAGWSAANDFVNLYGFQQCCTGNGARSIYYLWRNMLTFNEGQLRVNLLLNRAAPWADVYSHIPYKGQVDIKLKQDCGEVLVHAPEWIETGSDRIGVSVNDEARPLTWDERYVNLGPAKSGDKIGVNFPISERTVKERIGGIDCTLVVRGSTVVLIDPPGKWGRLYERDHLRNDHTMWRKIERFVSEELPYF